MSINATKHAHLIQFNEPTGSTFIVDAAAMAGVRLYKYVDKVTGNPMWAIKLFFDMVGQEPIVYNGYSVEADAIYDLNRVIEMMGD